MTSNDRQQSAPLADPVFDRGGVHRFAISDEVSWQGQPATVIALTVEPSATIEFQRGDRLTVGQSTLAPRPGGSSGAGS
jgi:hypothetical protein